MLILTAQKMSSTTGSNNNSIAAVASRIQERAIEYTNEQKNLKINQNKLAEAKDILERETSKNESLRKELLEKETKRNEAELDLIRLREEINETNDIKKVSPKNRATLPCVTSEVEKLKKEKDDMLTEWNRLEREVYSKHHTKVELYKRKIEVELNERESKKERLESELVTLKYKIEHAKQDTRSIKKEISQIRQQNSEMGELEEKENEEISSFHFQIKECLSKRASLRLKEQMAQDLLDEANHCMVTVEKERSDFVSKLNN